MFNNLSQRNDDPLSCIMFFNTNNKQRINIMKKISNIKMLALFLDYGFVAVADLHAKGEEIQGILNRAGLGNIGHRQLRLLFEELRMSIAQLDTVGHIHTRLQRQPHADSHNVDIISCGCIAECTMCRETIVADLKVITST